jgi:hypothetical protein
VTESATWISAFGLIRRHLVMHDVPVQPWVTMILASRVYCGARGGINKHCDPTKSSSRGPADHRKHNKLLELLGRFLVA